MKLILPLNMKGKTWICALAGIWATSFGQAQLPWEAAYWDAIDNLKETPMAVKLWAEEVQYRAIASGDCDSLNLARAVLTTMLNVKGAEAPLESSWAPSETCDTSGYVTWYSIGVHHYLNHRLLQAKDAFERSLTFGPTTSRQVSTWHAIGSLSNQLGELESAYDAYKKAFELEPEPDNPIRLNNLATINLSLHDYETALDWLKLAEEAWLNHREEWVQKLPEDFGEVILRNRLLCTYELEMWKEAEAIFNRLTPGEFSGQDPIAGATIVLNYLLRSNRYDVFQRLKGPLTRAFGTDSTRTVYSLGSAAMLFSLWRPADSNENELWQQIQGSPDWTWQSPWDDPVNGSENKAQSPPIDGELGANTARNPWSPISWGTLLLLTVGGLWTSRNLRAQQRTEKMAKADQVAFLKSLENMKSVADMIKGPSDAFDFERLPWLASNRLDDVEAPSLSQLRQRVPEWEDLTEKEKEVLYWSLQGLNSADLADRLKCKKSHIYNLRTRMRTKLKLEKNADFADWWRSLPFWLCMLSSVMVSGNSVAAADWEASMELALTETTRPDTLGFLDLDSTQNWSAIENWRYHVWAAVAANDSGRLFALPPVPSPTPNWLVPFGDFQLQRKGHLPFDALRLTAPRIEEHLRRELSPEPQLSTLETEPWVKQGTPEDQRLARLHTLQWGLFFATLLAGGIAGILRWKRRGDPQIAHPAEFLPTILTSSEVDLNRSVIEQCLTSPHPSSAEVRAAVYSVEILGLPLRELQAMKMGQLPEIWSELTQKEKQVAFLLALRYPPQQIAEILQCAPAYIYNLKSALRKKWGLANSSELDRALMALI